MLVAGELHDAPKLLRKAAQTMVATFHDDLLRAGIAFDGSTVIEHLIARLDEQKVAISCYGGGAEAGAPHANVLAPPLPPPARPELLWTPRSAPGHAGRV